MKRFTMKHGGEFTLLRTRAVAFTLAAGILLFPYRLLCQVGPDSTQVAAWSEFNESYGNNWIIRWNEQTGTPGFIYGYQTVPYSGTAEEIARGFLLDNHTIFKMEGSLQDLNVKRIRENHGITHVTFTQHYMELPVYSAEYYVHIDSTGCIRMINGTYFPIIQY